MSFFTLNHTDENSRARAGIIKTDHGLIETPIFMPVGTIGSVKAIEQRELIEIGAQIILGNTYHLYLRPGEDVLSHFAGHHAFISWDKPILTDSGGYQVFSLKELRKITEQGVEFRSHIDGSKHFFSPERVIEIQRCIGSDIMMVLDECTSFPATYDEAKISMDLTLRWAKRNKDAFVSTSSRYGHAQYLFGIGQGSTYKDLRTECMSRLIDLDFDGYAIGGLAVGEPSFDMYDIIDHSTRTMPRDKPRYLMGVGTPDDIVESVSRGIDMFDCVMPTRAGRHGLAYTRFGKINLRNAKHASDPRPLDPESA